LYYNDLAIEFSFNESLKVLKNLKDIGSSLEKRDPREFDAIIYEAHIISMSTNRTRGRALNIRED